MEKYENAAIGEEILMKLLLGQSKRRVEYDRAGRIIIYKGNAKDKTALNQRYEGGHQGFKWCTNSSHPIASKLGFPTSLLSDREQGGLSRAAAAAVPSRVVVVVVVVKKASDMVKHINMETIQQLYNEVSPESLGIADLGCSSGPNSLLPIKDVVEAVEGGGGYPGSFYGRLFPNNCLHFIYSSYSLRWLSKGEIEKEKVDCYNVHFYAASRNEIEDQVRRDGSFELERVEMYEIEKQVKGRESYGTAVAITVKAIQESMLYNHFGNGINLDTLFNNYAKMVDQEMAKQEINPITFLLVLKKL
ncbi:putative TRNA--methyltransferase non-catalytic subunit trm6MTase subunit trm6 [Hibiscus syriacus]|uniref:tRNA--methyltransferase non-catalytic subunit trm6MTase subunit trm6 n=1 Tax=Hibiscus syriacus TaxID=106335 RepID=A0A6A3BSS8_HIBSY|nr:putative TRNA--methyltransferase non-catalytic subunit trm6MTase subunit trm6 [Hibiscus syriacus]